jgi:hypothetical protein
MLGLSAWLSLKVLGYHSTFGFLFWTWISGKKMYKIHCSISSPSSFCIFITQRFWKVTDLFTWEMFVPSMRDFLPSLWDLSLQNCWDSLRPCVSFSLEGDDHVTYLYWKELYIRKHNGSVYSMQQSSRLQEIWDDMKSHSSNDESGKMFSL